MTSSDGSSRPALPRYLALLWEREDPTPRRGPRPTITIRDIGAAGAAIADTRGIDAVSMKAIASELGLTTMSLYRYVDSKDDVLEVMVDTAYGTADPGLTATGTWRERVTAWAMAVAEGLRGRPWLATIAMSRPPTGPNVLSWTNSGVRSFTGTPLTGQQKMSALLLVDGFVRQHVRQASQMGLLGDGPPNAERPYEAMITELADPHRFPDLAAAMGPPEWTDDDNFFTDQLRFGLSVILDGVAALIEGTPTAG